jgi:hypothetical protein
MEGKSDFQPRRIGQQRIFGAEVFMGLAQALQMVQDGTAEQKIEPDGKGGVKTRTIIDRASGKVIYFEDREGLNNLG